MRLTERNNGTRVVIPVGERVEIGLSENPTTGFRWSFIDLDSSVHVTDDGYDQEGDMTPGASTIRLFGLNISHPGTYQLALWLWRDWEGESSTIDRYSVTLEATDIG